MAITFLEKRKRLRYLFPILAIIVLITAIVIWRGFFVKEKPVLPPIEKAPAKKIEINFETLKNPLLQELQTFEEIPPFEEEVGRENPFIPY